MLNAVLIFRGDFQADLPLAKKLMLEQRTKGIKAVIRLAPVFDGYLEECERVVLLPLVHPNHAARIISAYEAALIPVERYVEDLIEENTTPPWIDDVTVVNPNAKTVASDDQPKTTPTPDHLRRLSNRQLRDVAKSHGLDVSAEHPERATIIAAILAAGQKANTS